MANLNFIFSVKIFALTSSISIMKMLAEQAEKNVLLAVQEADEPGAVKENEFEDEGHDENGDSYQYTRTYYSCGSSVGYDYDEVKDDYKFLITQLTRRSAFLTIFGLFEHRINDCLELMINLAKYESELKSLGAIEKAQTILKKGMGKNIDDVDHLTIIRNIMIHNDGNASGYHKILAKKDKKTEYERRLMSAIKRTKEVKINDFNGIIMDGEFLTYAVSEFNRYATCLEQAIQNCHVENPNESGIPCSGS